MSLSKSSLIVTLLLMLMLSINVAEKFDAATSGETQLQPSNRNLCPTKTKTLHLVAMGPFPDSEPDLNPGWAGGPAVIPGSQLAVKHINSRCDVLDGFKLELIVADSGCNVVMKAYVNFTSSVYDKRNHIVGIVGPGCSEATAAIGRLIAGDNISLLNIAPSATSPMLVNRTLYPNTFRAIPSSLGYLKSHSDLTRTMGYTSVGILFEASRMVHVAASNQLLLTLQEFQIPIVTLGMYTTSIPLDEIKFKQRILFVFGGAGVCTQLMCMAYHKGMLYPDYQYIFTDRRLNHFLVNSSFHIGGRKFDCSVEQMTEAVTGTILILPQLTRQDVNTILVNGMNYTSFYEEYKSMLEAYKAELGLLKVVDTEHQSGFYDSTWALALSLNGSMRRLRDEMNMSLYDYKLGHPNVTDIIRNELLGVEFEGIRGTVSFSNKTFDTEDVAVFELHFVQGRSILVGIYDSAKPNGQNLVLEDESVFINSEFDQIIISPPVLVVGVVYVALLLTTVILVFLHLANVKWLRMHSMKVTSPALNHIIFSGCYLYLLSTLFLTVQQTVTVNNPVLYGVKCSAFVWCESISLTLIFGTIGIKSWRIFRIFSNISPRIINSLQDYQLVLYICLLLLVDIIFLLLWNIIDPWRVSTAAKEQLKIHFKCGCDDLILWISCLFGIKLVLIVFVFYLSIRTRRVPKLEYKQTKTTNGLIYSLLFIYSFCIATHVILLNSTSVTLTTVSYLALCVKNFTAIFLCMFFILLPPVLPVLKEKWFEYTGCTCLHHLRIVSISQQRDPMPFTRVKVKN